MQPEVTAVQAAPGLWGRLGRGLRWLAPGVGLVLVPKCPACLAGYIALFTGVGVTLPLAQALRVTLLAACAVCLVWLAVNALRRRWRKSSG